MSSRASSQREAALVATKADEAHLWAGRLVTHNATSLPSADELLAELER